MTKAEQEQAKKNVAAKASELVRDGMTVGIGSGSTVSYLIDQLGKKVEQGLTIKAVVASVRCETQARSWGIEIIEPGGTDEIDVAIDGADEVDTNGNLTKGGGGSLLREKIIAYASKSFYVMVDETKVVDRLGAFPLPVEIIPFGSGITLNHIKGLNAQPVIRKRDEKVFVTDNGNIIADCKFQEITDPAWLDVRLKMIPGVAETGLFSWKVVTGILIGYHDGSVKEVFPGR